jgi:hypothetical protein
MRFALKQGFVVLFILLFLVTIRFHLPLVQDDSQFERLDTKPAALPLSSPPPSSPLRPSQESIDPVHWVRDNEWFQQQATAGCCPYAKFLYETRYSNVDYRCCTAKWPAAGAAAAATNNSDFLEPLKPVGGLGFLEYWQRMPADSHSLKNHTFVLIQGDSLAEQHFLGMVCLAWSSSIPVHWDADPKMWSPGNKFVATLEGDDNASIMTITFVRWNQPVLAPVALTGNLSEPDVVILGGWHHGGVKTPQLARFLGDVHKQRGRVEKPTILVEALPNHFPGGAYSSRQVYPPVQRASSTRRRLAGVTIEEAQQLLPVCDTTSLKSDPDINGALGDLVVNKSHVHILHLEHLFRHRGDAHIGIIPTGTPGPQGRDCLHFCVAPGVLDAIAKQTLGNVARLLSEYFVTVL